MKCSKIFPKKSPGVIDPCLEKAKQELEQDKEKAKQELEQEKRTFFVQRYTVRYNEMDLQFESKERGQ